MTQFRSRLLLALLATILPSAAFAQDVTGPVVTAISFSRNTADVTTAPQLVTVTVTLQDTPSGLRGGRLYLINPQGGATLDVPFYSGSPPYPVTPVTRTFGATVPRYIAPGTYRWKVVSLDAQPRESTYGFGGLPFPGGVSDQITVQNTGPVEAARPVLVSHGLSVLEIRPQELPKSLTVTARATDDVGVSRVEFHFQDPDYPTLKSTKFMSRTAGTALDGTWSVTFNVSTTYKPGTYQFGFSVYDNGSVFPVDYGAYGGSPALPLPAGGPTQLTILSWHTEGHAYSVWRGQRAALAGAAGEPAADPDGDNMVNVLEFLCGTDPLLNSTSTATDPAALRAPRLVPKAGYIRLEYRLSAANAALGTGNAYRIEPQAKSYAASPWDTSFPQGRVGSSDLYYAEVPISNPRVFIRLRIMP